MPISPQDRGTRGLSASLTWAASLALFAFGGYWLDRKLGTLPLFLLVGSMIGAVGGFIHFLATLAPEMLPFSKKKASPPKGKPGTPAGDGTGTAEKPSAPPEHEPRHPS